MDKRRKEIMEEERDKRDYTTRYFDSLENILEKERENKYKYANF